MENLQRIMPRVHYNMKMDDWAFYEKKYYNRSFQHNFDYDIAHSEKECFRMPIQVRSSVLFIVFFFHLVSDGLLRSDDFSSASVLSRCLLW